MAARALPVLIAIVNSMFGQIPPSVKAGIPGTVSSSGPDHWMRRGFGLKAIVAEISGTTPNRIEVPAGQLTAVTLNSSMEEFRRELEDGLHRPILDEAGLTGIYDFKIQGEPRTTEEFLGMPRDQLSLVVTPTRRSLEIVIIRPVE